MKLGLILALFICIGCTSKKEQPSKNVQNPKVSLQTTQTNFIAGSPINLKFKTSNNNAPLKLLLKNAFGSVIIKKDTTNTALASFNIPKNYCRLAGNLHWKLLHQNIPLLKGKLYIETNTKNKTHVETYFGPRSITAGYNDYSMLTVVPTDIYDNPVDDSTQVTVKYQFQKNINETSLNTNNFIAWYNVRSTTKAGRILVTSESNGTTSKELTTIVFPSNAEDFKITASSAHNYADGNQIITFKSNIIKDKYGNTVSDGTLVNFIIKDEKGAYLNTVGTTISGIAETRTLHPDYAAKWTIKAFITGAAESNTINFNFEAAIKDYPIQFYENNRKLVIGPFKSFMKQLVPDGILVKIDIYDKKGNFIETKNTTTKNGVSSIYLETHYLPNDTYNFKIKAAGITKEYTKDLYGN
ncbi:hypothetical protein FUA26_00355 [Seonamhaeicola algicola]|uniref:Uncharacterized protein n=1 Tax=Seonamhaeicola algicola TaxID=1719036 RepID=A0A5C7B3I0_9FLAO|nr:hypothetical protein [Seonamhaeicola algicola]TXE14994.1 hypothetical protein FUA26_00355 [Seonamhaeicola algicola]